MDVIGLTITQMCNYYSSVRYRKNRIVRLSIIFKSINTFVFENSCYTLRLYIRYTRLNKTLHHFSVYFLRIKPD